MERLRELLGPLEVLPSSRGRWVALQEGILRDDDSLISAHFADAQGVHFLKVGCTTSRLNLDKFWGSCDPLQYLLVTIRGWPYSSKRATQESGSPLACTQSSGLVEGRVAAVKACQLMGGGRPAAPLTVGRACTASVAGVASCDRSIRHAAVVKHWEHQVCWSRTGSARHATAVT